MLPGLAVVLGGGGGGAPWGILGGGAPWGILGGGASWGLLGGGADPAKFTFNINFRDKLVSPHNRGMQTRVGRGFRNAGR